MRVWVFRPVAAAVVVALLALPAAPAAAGERFEEVVRFGTGPGMDRVLDMARDDAGNTYVAGSTYGAFPGFTNELEADGFIVKLDPAGEVVWADQFGGDDNGENGAHAITLDGAGGVYVAGVTQQDLHAALQGYSDPFVRKYAEDGRLLWGSQFAGPGSLEVASGVAVSAGTVYVTGGSYDGAGFLRRYSTAGALLAAGEEPRTLFWDIATAGDEVYAVGSRWASDDAPPAGFVRRITATGTREVAFAGSHEPMRLAVGVDAVAASGTGGEGGGDTVITKWSRDLRELWTSTGNVDPSCGCGQPVWALAMSAAGDVFAAGGADWPDGFVRKHLGATGERAWEAHLEAAGWGVGGMVVEGDRVVFAGASASELASDGTGAFVATWSAMRTVPLTRLAGTDRIATALAVSQEAYPTGAEGAVLTSALDFPDALVAAPLAAMVDGPVLQTGGTLPTAVADELQRLMPAGGTVTVVGGAAAVSVAVEQAVRALGFEVDRIAGATRYDTAVDVARALGGPPAIVVDGRLFPDALVAGPAAIASGQAIVLSAGPTLPAITRSYLLETGPGHVAVGGRAAEATPGAEVVAGVDRFETAVRVMERFFAAPHVIGLASSTSFADALAIAPLLGREAGPMLLTPPDRLAELVAPHIGLQLLEVYVVGGTAAIGQGVEQTLQGLLTEAR
jgi:putative cell wall-binding protein